MVIDGWGQQWALAIVVMWQQWLVLETVVGVDDGGGQNEMICLFVDDNKSSIRVCQHLICGWLTNYNIY